MEPAVKQAAYQVYYDTAILVRDNEAEEGILPLNSIIIRRNSLDVHFFTALLKHNNIVELQKIVPILTRDHEYHQAWDKWNSTQRFINTYREMINDEIKEKIRTS